jgi:hypothetical protein
MKEKILSYLSTLSIGRWFKPVWKWALLQGVDPAIEWLSEQLSRAVQSGVGKAGKEVKSLILGFEKQLVGHIKGSIIPDDQEEILISRVISLCEQLQGAIPVALDAGSAAMVEDRIKGILRVGGETLKNQIRAL